MVPDAVGAFSSAAIRKSDFGDLAVADHLRADLDQLYTKRDQLRLWVQAVHGGIFKRS